MKEAGRLTTASCFYSSSKCHGPVSRMHLLPHLMPHIHSAKNTLLSSVSKAPTPCKPTIIPECQVPVLRNTLPGCFRPYRTHSQKMNLITPKLPFYTFCFIPTPNNNRHSLRTQRPHQIRK